MREHDIDELSFDDYDELRDPRTEDNGFDVVVDAAMSRRGFLGGVVAFGSGAAVMVTTFLASEAQAANRFGFKPIPTSTTNTITLPEGYEWEVLVNPDR